MEIDKELKEFLQTHPKTNFMQTPEWAEVKTDWKNEFIVVKDEKRKNKRYNEHITKKSTNV